MELNLKQAFKNIFGYEAPPSFNLEHANTRKQHALLGAPYYESDLWGREFFLPVKIDGMLIPFAVMSMNWKKTIVETPMPERGGSVKEIISIDDYIFNLKGLLVNENGEFPEQEIIDLHKLFLKSTAVEMRSALSDIVLNGTYNHNVIIREVKWPSTPGVEHVKAFDIDLESDQIFELNISEETFKVKTN